MAIRKAKSNCEAQVGLLNESLQGIDSSHPTYPLWTRLTTFLGSLCEAMNDLQLAVRGDGNGKRGLLERMTVIEGSVKVTQSDIREVLNTMREVYGIDRDVIQKQFDKGNHPKRREADDQANRLLRYVVDRILPPVIVWIILGGLAFMIAVNQRILIQGQ